jgi:enoyl-CoA hydratase
LVIVASEAKLRFPEISLGTFVGGGTIYTLPRRVGLAAAKELILLGEFFTGADAAAMGLANRAVPAADVLPTALDMAARLAAKAPVSMAFAKRLLNRAHHLDPETAMDLEAEALIACMQTKDWKEGIEAFAEKREPRFIGE